MHWHLTQDRCFRRPGCWVCVWLHCLGPVQYMEAAWWQHSAARHVVWLSCAKFEPSDWITFEESCSGRKAVARSELSRYFPDGTLIDAVLRELSRPFV